VAQLLPMCPWGDVTPELPEQGCGGRETAVVRTSRELALMGHESWVVAPMSSPLRTGLGETYVPVEGARELLGSVPFDAVVSVEFPGIWRDERVMAAQASALRVTHMQVAHVDPGQLEGLDEDSFVLTGLSPWHVEFLKQQLPKELAGIRTAVVPNGCELSLYPRSFAMHPLRDGGLSAVYSSSPDRGLVHVLEAWPLVREGLRGAPCELRVAYDALSWARGASAWSHMREGDVARRVVQGMAQPGVRDLGRLPQSALATWQLRSEMCVYPCDTMQPTETGCVTLIEAAAAGLPIVTTDCDCIGEEFGSVAEVMPLPVGPNELAGRVLELWWDEPRRRQMRAAGREFAEGRSWRCSADALVALADRAPAAA
jgi:glycosyltransferase involved in cell wall biosynthesis